MGWGGDGWSGTVLRMMLIVLRVRLFSFSCCLYLSYSSYVYCSSQSSYYCFGVLFIIFTNLRDLLFLVRILFIVCLLLVVLLILVVLLRILIILLFLLLLS